MWNLYRLATTTRQRPSDLVGIEDRWAAYQFDSAVVFMGRVIENKLEERVETGAGKSKQRVPRYTIEQILDKEFRFAMEPKERDKQKAAIDTLRMWASLGGGRVGYTVVSDPAKLN